VIITSLPTIIMTIHQGIKLTIANPIKAAEVRILSASGSQNFPQLVM
jgi:hypothetical protein